MDLQKINTLLRHQSPRTILRWALNQPQRAFASTSFGAQSAALLHLVSEEAPEMPVIWVDHGYNVKPTYKHAEFLTKTLKLNLKVYSPVVTTERRQAIFGGVPLVTEEKAFESFVYDVKLEPFKRAMKDVGGELWLTGIRRDETAHRQTLDIVTIDAQGILKVAPFFYFSEDDMRTYLDEYNLPVSSHYFDPTKVSANAECGLHHSL